nr:MAG TPA: hypothetical protein [Caudoviricetes sp.]
MLIAYQTAAFFYPNNPYMRKSCAFNPPPLGGFLLAVVNVKLQNLITLHFK